ncbi:MAG: hypothetical protein LBS41_01935 [Streptococcaceae bacterium]|jgi:ribosomal protein S18 acetylase RimI-like enzyme|nr:hypothetical protein [Streptococcaceae bacterium]
MLYYQPYDISLNADVMQIYANNLDYLTLANEEFDQETLIQGLMERPNGVPLSQKQVRLVYRADKPVAIVDYILGYKTATSLYIGLLLVKDRGQGIGSQILADLNHRYPEFQILELGVLTNNIRGLNFWQGQGFEIIDTVAYQGTLKVHRMQKHL